MSRQYVTALNEGFRAKLLPLLQHIIPVELQYSSDQVRDAACIRFMRSRVPHHNARSICTTFVLTMLGSHIAHLMAIDAPVVALGPSSASCQCVVTTAMV